MLKGQLLLIIQKATKIPFPSLQTVACAFRYRFPPGPSNTDFDAWATFPEIAKEATCKKHPYILGIYF